MSKPDECITLNTKHMITKELSGEQIILLSEAILAQMNSIKKAREMSFNSAISDACTIEIGKLRALLDYINE